MGRLDSLRTLVLAGALALAAGTGCFLDEIDKSMATYPGKAAEKAKAKSEATSVEEGAKPSGSSWWETARTIGPELQDETITSCALGGRTEFMRRDNCLARGGRPQ